MTLAVPTGGATVAVVAGSGLAALPDDFHVVRRVGYQEIGWPMTAVAGHPNELLQAAAADGRSLLFAGGRPHVYEGWRPAEMERQLSDLAGWGIRQVLLTYAVGSLWTGLDPGTVVVVESLADLQERTDDDASVCPATAGPLAERAAAVLRPLAPVRIGRYVSVVGPQFETPAEVRWLRQLGDVVGMSGAAELRAARRLGLAPLVLAAVLNHAGRVGSHTEVLNAAATMHRLLGRCMGMLLKTLSGAGWEDGGRPGEEA